MSSRKRDSVVIVTSFEESSPQNSSPQSQFSSPASSGNREPSEPGGAPFTDIDERDHGPVPKHERFAQLLAMRLQRRHEVSVRNSLDDVEDAALGSTSGSPKPLKRSSMSSSSFAALPTSTQNIRKIMASIDQAREEESQEAARRQAEAAIEKDRAQRLAARTSGEHSWYDEARVLAHVNKIFAPSSTPVVAARQGVTGSTASDSAMSAIPGFHYREKEMRIMTHVDFALKSRVRVYPADQTGIESLCGLVSGKETTLLAPKQLMVPDEPLVFDLPEAAAANSKQKKSTGKFGSGGKKTLADSSPSGSGNQMGRGPRLPIGDMMRSYEDHRLIVEKALAGLHSASGPKLDAKLASRLQEREGSRTCEPIPGIRTVLYFPSPADGIVRLREDLRANALRSVTKKTTTTGMPWQPLVWEYLTSQCLGCLGYRCYRHFNTVFEFTVVMTPKQLYLNLERMCRGLATPQVLRRVVYLCCGRPTRELTVWGVLHRHYMDAKKGRYVSTWLQRLHEENAQRTNRRTPFSVPDVDMCEDLDDRMCSLDDDEAECAECSSNVWAHPFGLVDFALEAVLDSEHAAMNPAEAPQRFSEWFASAEVPTAQIFGRLQKILARNTYETQLLDMYLTLLPVDATMKRRAFEELLGNGFLPSSDVWVPPNVTTKSLEELENQCSAKAGVHRDAKMLMNFLTRFRTQYHLALQSWVGQPVGADDDSASSALSLLSSMAAGEEGTVKQRRGITSGGGAKQQAVRLLYTSPNTDLLTAVAEDMHPGWTRPEGWERDDHGGVAPRPGTGDIKRKSKKPDRHGDRFPTKVKTKLSSELPVLESTGVVFLPTSARSLEDSAASISVPRSVLSDDESDDSSTATSPVANSSPKKPVLQPHPQYTDWDPWTLYLGQGLYYEAFVKLMCASPPFARDAFGLLLRYATHFSSVE